MIMTFLSSQVSYLANCPAVVLFANGCVQESPKLHLPGFFLLIQESLDLPEFSYLLSLVLGGGVGSHIFYLLG